MNRKNIQKNKLNDIAILKFSKIKKYFLKLISIHLPMYCKKTVVINLMSYQNK